MLQRAIRIAREAGASPIFVVLGANREVIGDALDFGSAIIIANGEWNEGIASSIRAGVSAVESKAPAAQGVLLMSCDQPRVAKPHLRQMIETFLGKPVPTAIASGYAGIHGVPAIFPRQAFPDLLALRGDQGARRLLVDQSWPVVALPLEGGEIDIDQPEDLTKVQCMMTRRPNLDFLRRAIELATRNVSSGNGGPFAALIVRNGQVIAEGVNLVTATNDPTAHGEVTAIRNACKTLNTFTLAGCQLYTSCEPCPMCLAASHWARLDAVFYGAGAEDAAKAGFDDAYLYGEFRKDAAERSLPEAQYLRDEAWASFAAWIASPNKILY
jgi:tRNA(Arg) A34 adenosine deaminase TadA/CTP:molybdopterin cytidylyltransferase MocA